MSLLLSEASTLSLVSVIGRKRMSHKEGKCGYSGIKKNKKNVFLPHLLLLALSLIFFHTNFLVAQNALPITIELVPVDAPCNPEDTRTGLGKVDYEYQIGKFDVTVAQYCEFLKAVAKKDPHGIYDIDMDRDSAVHCIIRSLNSKKEYEYQIVPGRENYPITIISFLNAIRFCNWMSNHQPTGNQDTSTTEDGSYLITEKSVSVRANATWRLPTDDEWYKAAYFNKNNPTHYWSYSTQSDDPPGNSAAEEDNQEDSPTKNANYCLHEKPTIVMGSISITPGHSMYPFGFPDLTPVGIFSASPGPFGTYDMGGNAKQWTTGVVLYRETQLVTLRGYSRYCGLPWEGHTMDYTSHSCIGPSLSPCDVSFRLVYMKKIHENDLGPPPFSISYLIKNSGTPESHTRTWSEYWNLWWSYL